MTAYTLFSGVTAPQSPPSVGQLVAVNGQSPTQQVFTLSLALTAAGQAAAAFGERCTVEIVGSNDGQNFTSVATFGDTPVSSSGQAAVTNTTTSSFAYYAGYVSNISGYGYVSATLTMVV